MPVVVAVVSVTFVFFFLMNTVVFVCCLHDTVVAMLSCPSIERTCRTTPRKHLVSQYFCARLSHPKIGVISNHL